MGGVFAAKDYICYMDFKLSTAPRCMYIIQSTDVDLRKMFIQFLLTMNYIVAVISKAVMFQSAMYI